MKNKKPVIVLAPHTDDGEFGCGGAIARFLDEGKEVYYFAFSACEASISPDLPSDTLVRELHNATTALGISREKVHCFNFPVRKFPEFRQDILEELIKIKSNIQPGMVFLPSTLDTHQDHNVIAKEGFRAFKGCSILGYEMPWNNLTFNTSCFIPLSSEHLERKIAALEKYESQRFRSYANRDFVTSLCRVRGTQIGVPFAEAYEAIRWIV